MEGVQILQVEVELKDENKIVEAFFSKESLILSFYFHFFHLLDKTRFYKASSFKSDQAWTNKPSVK